MKPSELVDLSFLLHQFPIKELELEIDKVTKLVNDVNYEHQTISQLAEKITNFTNTLNEIKQLVSESIDSVDTELTSHIEKLINQPYTMSTVEIEREYKATVLSSESEKAVRSKIEKYASWQHPALEIGPGDGKWTSHIVAGDPLYLLDVHKDFLDSSIKQFGQLYQKRVRLYQTGVNVNKSPTDVSDLPKGQFGFIFAWNVFDYFSPNIIEEYLQQCLTLLKPGGVMMFSFNNCEFRPCAELAESGLKGWTPKWLLTEILYRVGFEIINYDHREQTVHWIEIKKPGELKSIRGFQTLASIYEDPSRKPIDTGPEKVYNKQQIVRLKQIAIQMNLDSSDDIMRDKHTPHKLALMIEQARKQK